MPVAGVVWQTLHYLLGFERLGFEAYYVETHARTPSMLMTPRGRRQLGAGGRVHRRVMRRFGLADRWAFQALHDDGRCFGMSERELRAPLRLGRADDQPARRDAAAARAGGDRPARLPGDRPGPAADRAAARAARRRSTSSSPTAPSSPSPRTGAARLPPSRAATASTSARRASRSCSTSGRIARPQPADVFTTIGNWRQDWRDVTFEGERYTWSKHHEFLKFLDLPRRSGQAFELALSSCEPAEREMLVEQRLAGARRRSRSRADIDRYRDYIGALAGRVHRRQGPERAAAHRLVQRPQRHLPRRGPAGDHPGHRLRQRRCRRGEGLFGFDSLEEALAAVEAVDADYTAPRERGAPRSRGSTSATRSVLGPLLDELGAQPGRAQTSGARRAPSRPGCRSSRSRGARRSCLGPRSRRRSGNPVRRARCAGDPGRRQREHRRRRPRRPRLHPPLPGEPCLPTPTDCDFELIVVDNGSSDGTPAYLAKLAERNSHGVRVVSNGTNFGFAPACNQGLAPGRRGPSRAAQQRHDGPAGLAAAGCCAISPSRRSGWSGR